MDPSPSNGLPSGRDRRLPASASIRRAVRAREAALLEARKRLNLGELEARALMYVHDHRGCRMGELTAYLGITSAGGSVLVERLAQRELVERVADPNDRRSTLVHLLVDLTSAPWSDLLAFDIALEREVERLGLAEDLDRVAEVSSSVVRRGLLSG